MTSNDIANIVSDLECSANGNVLITGTFATKFDADAAISDWFATAESMLASIGLSDAEYSEVWAAFLAENGYLRAA